MVLLLAGCTSRPPTKASVIKTANVVWKEEMQGEVIWVGKILPLSGFPGTFVGSYIAVIPKDTQYVAGNFFLVRKPNEMFQYKGLRFTIKYKGYGNADSLKVWTQDDATKKIH